jgi:hypothetical protein
MRNGFLLVAGGVSLLAAAFASRVAIAACTTDETCKLECRDAICGSADPVRDIPRDFGECIDKCDAKTNCAGLVTCVRDCYEQRTEAREQCESERHRCVRTKCRVCAGGVSAADFTPSCKQQCRNARAACRAVVGRQRFNRRVCVDRCQRNCGEFPQFPEALEMCLSRCPEVDDAACGADFKDCKDRCP